MQVTGPELPLPNFSRFHEVGFFLETEEESSSALMETSDLVLVVLEVELQKAVMFAPAAQEILDLAFEDEVTYCFVEVVTSWAQLAVKSSEAAQMHLEWLQIVCAAVQQPLPQPVPGQLLWLTEFGKHQGLH